MLAPRTQRTGALGHYFARGMRNDVDDVVSSSFRGSLLSQMGVVDEPRLNEAWNRFRQGEDSSQAFSLFLTLQVELWLRARFPSDSTQTPRQLAEIA